MRRTSEERLSRFTGSSADVPADSTSPEKHRKTETAVRQPRPQLNVPGSYHAGGAEAEPLLSGQAESDADDSATG